MKKDRSISIILISFIAFIVAFNLFIQEVINKSDIVGNKILHIVNTSFLEINQVNLLIIVISSIVAILTIVIYFIVNKIILNVLKVKNIDSIKLLITILTSSLSGPIIALFIIFIGKVDPVSTLVTCISALTLPLFMGYLLASDFKNKKSLAIYVFTLLLLAILNIFISIKSIN